MTIWSTLKWLVITTVEVVLYYQVGEAELNRWGRMMRVERNAARAEHKVAELERKAPNEKAWTDHKRALAEELHLTTVVFELQLWFIMEEKGKRSRLPGGEPWVAGSRPESGRPVHSTLQSSATVGSGYITNLMGTDEDDG